MQTNGCTTVKCMALVGLSVYLLSSIINKNSNLPTLVKKDL